MCPGHFHAHEDSKKSFVQGCLETSDQAAQETDLRLQLLKVVVEGQDEWNNSTDGDDLLPPRVQSVAAPNGFKMSTNAA